MDIKNFKSCWLPRIGILSSISEQLSCYTRMNIYMRVCVCTYVCPYMILCPLTNYMLKPEVHIILANLLNCCLLPICLFLFYQSNMSCPDEGSMTLIRYLCCKDNSVFTCNLYANSKDFLLLHLAIPSKRLLL